MDKDSQYNKNQDIIDRLKYMDDAISLIKNQYEHPWRNLSLRISNRILMFLSSLRLVFSEKRRKKFRQSAEKRSDHSFIKSWSKKRSLGSIRDKFNDVKNNILVMDYRLPRADVSAGEKATYGILRDLCNLGFNVTFAPKDMHKTDKYWQEIVDLGVNVITSKDGYYSLHDYITQEGYNFATYYIIRFDVAEQALAAIDAVAPCARKIFHAPDLYFLRETRAAQLSKKNEDIEKADDTKRREIGVMNRCDHIVVVSPAEIPFLQKFIPGKEISVFPVLYADIENNVKSYDERQDIFFLGGYEHIPNVDSVIWFCQEVWPYIHQALPNVNFHIVGAKAPKKVRLLENIPGVNFIGYVENLNLLLQHFRIGVAPLLYGAGIKGKVAATLGAGIPCICTDIAAEGMGIENGYNGLVVNDPKEFANTVINIYNDKNLWNKLSKNGLELVKQKFSQRANCLDLLRVLQAAKALPLQLYKNFITDSPVGSFPYYDEKTIIDISIIIPVYNKWRLTEKCLKSVLESCSGINIKYEVILADDNSVDDTLRANQIFENLIISRTEENLGFLSNCNNAARLAKGRYLLFLNNDTIVLPNWLEKLFYTLEANKKIVIAGSKLLYLDGSIQEAGGILFRDGSACNLGRLGRGEKRYKPEFNIKKYVDYISGTSILVSKEFWDDYGGFDERYKPAYCEDSDLAIGAYHKNLLIAYVPQSEVIHFEHGSYNEEIKMKPRELQTINIKKLTQKWVQKLSSHPDTEHKDTNRDVLKSVALSENAPSERALKRRKTGNLNILYFSPFPSHPNNHGNQATIQAFGKKFQDFGHKVHFALLSSSMYTSDNLIEMGEEWDSLTLIPNNLQLSSNGKDIPFDSWYEKGLGEKLYDLCHQYDIDVVFFSYVFQSKMLEYVPKHILKIIDTHDKMGGRYDMLRKNNQPIEFFSCSEEEEGCYLRRADIVVARRQQEADYFNKAMGQNTSVVIPHIEDPNYLEKTFSQIRNVGIVASANRINLISIYDFLKAYYDELAGRESPVIIHIAGQVKDMVPSLSNEQQKLFHSSWVEIHGFVPDIKDFYNSVDIIMSPIMMGTGINVKTVQAMAYGMPILATECGIKGIETGDDRHNHDNLSSLVKTLLEIREDKDELNRLALVSKNRYKEFIDQHYTTMKNLFNR